MIGHTMGPASACRRSGSRLAPAVWGQADRNHYFSLIGMALEDVPVTFNLARPLAAPQGYRVPGVALTVCAT
jgi:hypothetical protein